MRVKLDENLGASIARIFRDAGHDAEGVLQENLSGASDDVLYNACMGERRCFVTMDLDFADPIRFPPHLSSGIVILRIPKGGRYPLVPALAADVASHCIRISGRHNLDRRTGANTRAAKENG